MPMSDNMVLNSYYSFPYSKKGIINQAEINKFAEKIFAENDVRSAHGIKSLAHGLSGGNQQKAIIGRELAPDPSIIVASQPTRGVDVGSIENIHRKLLKERENGKSIVLISYELDEIMQLADKIAIIFEGEIVEIREASTISKEEIGEYMAGGRSE
jgi:simple sugar transport system ATP-binding protein